MKGLAILAFALLAVLASVLPPVLALRETNAERLRRGEPPLPPSRREHERHPAASPSWGLVSHTCPRSPGTRWAPPSAVILVESPGTRWAPPSAVVLVESPGTRRAPSAVGLVEPPGTRWAPPSAVGLVESPGTPPSAVVFMEAISSVANPFLPSRREAAKRSQQPLSSGGAIEVRDSSGAHHLGYIDNVQCTSSGFDVTNSKSNALQAKFASSSLVATNAAFSSPFYLGATFNPGALPEETDFINVVAGSAGATIWSFDSTFPHGVPVIIVWDAFHKAVVFVEDLHAYQADAEQHEPSNQQPQVVVRLRPS
ncbi:hypothetical protein BC827DRAFT_1269275 [Russula dissimulans]|nr:hypothetical protein BC827DRAFT_1269275 [Russula dissimulans]